MTLSGMFDQRDEPYRAPRRLLTRHDVARYLGVSERTVGRLVSAGSLNALRVGRLVRFRDADVTALLERSIATDRRDRGVEKES